MMRAKEPGIRGMSIALLLGLLVSFPKGTAARSASPQQAIGFLSVIISEIAWGGTAAAPTHEWIELYNPGGLPVDLAGWRLAADDFDGHGGAARDVLAEEGLRCRGAPGVDVVEEEVFEIRVFG